MKLGVLKETHPGERRVAATPESVRKLVELGFEVHIEHAAGAEANYGDAAYEAAGARIAANPRETVAGAGVVLKLRAPSEAEVDLLDPGTTLISFLWPAQNPTLVERIAARGLTALAMDRIPRTTRAQKMDALSSTANLVGYRAVVEAAAQFGSFFTQQITAAGKCPPARVLIIGAGVAGLAAIGTARGLGAIVRAFDTRAAVREQVQSLGAEFLEVTLAEDGDGGGGYAREMSPAFIEAEMALFMEQARQVDVVITTALIPGKRAPILWPTTHVEAMKPGSVIIDLAAEQGGNCELTRAGEIVVHNGVKVVGFTDYASRLATTASNLYSTNLVHLLTDLGGGLRWNLNLDDEILRGVTVVRQGEVLPPPPPVQPSPAAAPAAKPATAAAAPATAPKPAAAPKPARSHGHSEPDAPGSGTVPAAIGLALAALWLWLRFATGSDAVGDATTAFLQHLTVFVLACFVGWQVVWNVSAALHTPLMSVTNAISGIILLGGMLQAKGDPLSPATLLGTAAILFAVINVAGGFLVTQRMLKMFRK